MVTLDIQAHQVTEELANTVELVEVVPHTLLALIIIVVAVELANTVGSVEVVLLTEAAQIKIVVVVQVIMVVSDKVRQIRRTLPTVRMTERRQVLAVTNTQVLNHPLQSLSGALKRQKIHHSLCHLPIMQVQFNRSQASSQAISNHNTLMQLIKEAIIQALLINHRLVLGAHRLASQSQYRLKNLFQINKLSRSGRLRVSLATITVQIMMISPKNKTKRIKKL